MSNEHALKVCNGDVVGNVLGILLRSFFGLDLEGARFPGACAAVTSPRGSPPSPVLLVAQAAAGALHAPDFMKLIILNQ